MIAIKQDTPIKSESNPWSDFIFVYLRDEVGDRVEISIHAIDMQRVIDHLREERLIP